MHLACDWNMSNFSGAKAMLLLLLGSINTTEVTRNPVSDGVEVGSLADLWDTENERHLKYLLGKYQSTFNLGGGGGGYLQRWASYF
jgi:hypothetical protein